MAMFQSQLTPKRHTLSEQSLFALIEQWPVSLFSELSDSLS